MTTRRKEKPATKAAYEFVTGHLGRNAFGCFTGTDTRAWQAFVYLLQLWGVSRDPSAKTAMYHTLACAQPSVMSIFIQTIPAMLDWCHVAELWPQIAPSRANPELAAVDTAEDGSVVRRYPGLRVAS
jgi:hypothetical protein